MLENRVTKKNWCKKSKLIIVFLVVLLVISSLPTVAYTNEVNSDIVNIPRYEYISMLEPVAHKELKISTDEDGTYTLVSNDDNFKILQLTDIHISGSEVNYTKDMKAITTVYKLIENTQPDLIVLTGDVVFGMPGNSKDDNMLALGTIIKLMDHIGIPWIWTFGNHDHCFFDNYTSAQINDMLSESSTLLMYPDDSEIYGYSNGTFKLCNKNGEVNTLLITLDSNTELYNKQKQTGVNDYEYIHDDQVNWYQQQIEKYSTADATVSSILFFHIPLTEYADLWNAYQDGDKDVICEFGDKREEVGCSSTVSTLFSKAVEIGSTKAMFCGHDHVNDYALCYKGIQLVYGKSIDYTAYVGIENETEQRGATIATIASDSSIKIEQVKYVDISQK